MTTYSSFFSSGLLAEPQSAYDFRNTIPSVPSSPAPSFLSDIMDDTSDIEIDRMERERSTTPTPSSGPGATVNGTQPRLRKRRSSLTMGTSALNNIKSPMRSAGNAFQFQRHLQGTPSRARSGSLSSVITYEEETLPPAPAPITVEANKRKNRLRSGSIGTALKGRSASARSIPRAMPPPEAPLPPLPPLPSTPTHMKSFSIPPRYSMPPVSAIVMSSSSRQVLGELQP